MRHFHSALLCCLSLTIFQACGPVDEFEDEVFPDDVQDTEQALTAPKPRLLSPDKTKRTYVLGLTQTFVNKLPTLSDAELQKMKAALTKDDILLLPIQKMATPQDIKETVDAVDAHFPNQRLFIFPYAGRASLMFQPGAWSSIPGTDTIKGILPETLAKLDGVLIDHEPDAYCHTLDERERALPEHVAFNKMICASSKLPKITKVNWGTSYAASVSFLKPLVNNIRTRYTAARDQLHLTKKAIFVGLVPSGVTLNTRAYNNAKLLAAVGGDGQIIQTQAFCRQSAQQFGKQVDQLLKEYKEQVAQTNIRALAKSNLGIQITVGDAMNNDNAIVDLQRTSACIRSVAGDGIGTILLFHMNVDYFDDFMAAVNGLRSRQ